MFEMGLDAPSTDLTARIQERRRALVLSGEVEPARPGERTIHGKQPGAHAAFETAGAAVSLAAERRAARARASDAVVEMDYTDYSAAADADEPFDIEPEHAGAEETGLEPEPEPEPEPAPELEYAERVLLDDDGLVLAVAGLGEGISTLLTRQDSYDRALIALATGIGEELEAIRRAVEAGAAVGECCYVAPEPKRGFFARLFG